MYVQNTLNATPENDGKPFTVDHAIVGPPINFTEVEEVRVWNDDLSASQVSTAFQCTNFQCCGGKCFILTFHLPF